MLWLTYISVFDSVCQNSNAMFGWSYFNFEKTFKNIVYIASVCFKTLRIIEADKIIHLPANNEKSWWKYEAADKILFSLSLSLSFTLFQLFHFSGFFLSISVHLWILIKIPSSLVTNSPISEPDFFSDEILNPDSKLDESSSLLHRIKP